MHINIYIERVYIVIIYAIRARNFLTPLGRMAPWLLGLQDRSCGGPGGPGAPGTGNPGGLGKTRSSKWPLWPRVRHRPGLKWLLARGFGHLAPRTRGQERGTGEALDSGWRPEGLPDGCPPRGARGSEARCGGEIMVIADHNMPRHPLYTSKAPRLSAYLASGHWSPGPLNAPAPTFSHRAP